MELMFCPHSTSDHDFMNDLHPARWLGKDCSIFKSAKEFSHIRARDVLFARQCAAENAAWWEKELIRWDMIARRACELQEDTIAFDKSYFAMQMCRAWNRVYRQGQLYAKDSVNPFDPRYGEEK